jgi:hypothetical protein
VKNKFQLVFAVAALFAVGVACNMSTANMSSLKVGKDKEVKTEAASFKGGDTIYGLAEISNSMSEVTVKFRLNAEDVKGITKGEVVPGSSVEVKLPSSGTASYSLPVPNGVEGGKYILTADMHNEAGEKKDTKSVNITIEGSKAAAPTKSDDSDDSAEDK